MIETATSVREAMSTLVVGIVPEAAVSVALRLVAVRGVGHLPVIVGGRCVGMVHESDLLWHAWAGSDGDPVGAVLRVEVPTVEAGCSLAEAVVLMLGARTDVLLVLDRGRIAGILTAVDALRGLTTHP